MYHATFTHITQTLHAVHARHPQPAIPCTATLGAQAPKNVTATAFF